MNNIEYRLIAFLAFAFSAFPLKAHGPEEIYAGVFGFIIFLLFATIFLILPYKKTSERVLILLITLVFYLAAITLIVNLELSYKWDIALLTGITLCGFFFSVKGWVLLKKLFNRNLR